MCISVDCQSQEQRLAFVQYSFDRHEHSVELRPHGNSKGKEPFSRTKPSTVKLLKDAVQTKSPRVVLREVENIKGGVANAHSAGDLPRNRKQVDNFKFSTKPQCNVKKDLSCQNDVLAHVMQMCKDSCGTDKEFVRAVEAAPEPMCVLSTNQQLLDLERFCTGEEASIASIDPTFNLGPFSVTPITYHNLLVKTTRNGNHPILLGPVLIHQTKTLRPFHYFASTLIRLNPKLSGLKAYGTDGEPELIKAFSICFPKAVHLRCTNHIRQNIKDKLRQLSIPQHVSKEILADIFGTKIGTQFESGLADAESELIFTRSLEQVKAKWNNLEMSCNGSSVSPQFHAWFCDHKAAEFKKNILPKVRHLAGFRGSFFTTNCSESLNHVIKQEVQWKESNLPKLIDNLKSIADDQIHETEKAVIGQGEWRFSEHYSSLVVSNISWFSQMSDSTKSIHMKKVFSQKPSCVSERSQSSVNDCPVLSVPVDECEITSVSQSTLRNIWSKAEQLIRSDGHIIKVPWVSDNMARLVKSSSSQQPHLVTRNPKKMNVFCCDKNCQMFKGFSICSHVVATAQVNGQLKSYLTEISGICRPNFTAISSQGMPSGAGRKGGLCKRKRNRKLPGIETRSLRPCLEPDSMQSSFELSLPRSCTNSHSDTSSSLSATPLLHSGVSTVSSQAATIPSSSENQTTTGVGAFSHSLCDNSNSLPGIPSISCVVSSPTFTVLNSTQNQISVGASICISPTVTATAPMSTSAGANTSHNYAAPSTTTKNPFVLKLKTKQIKVCQSCRQNYDGVNDTLGLVVARAERRLISNLATGVQFLGKESNSHYHLHLSCLKSADMSFTGKDLMVPDDIKPALSAVQKMYLATCFGIFML